MRIRRSDLIAGALASVIAPLRVEASPNSGRFYFFWRPGGAVVVKGFLVEGHVGFAYQAATPWEFVAGSVENAHNDLSPKGKGFFHTPTANPVLQMGAADNVHADPAWTTRYDFYTYVDVPNANPQKAREALDDIAQRWFSAPGADCLDAVREVYKAYGGSLPRALDLEPSPNRFMLGLPAPAPRAITIPWPLALADASLYVEDNRLGERDDLVLYKLDSVLHGNFYSDATAMRDEARVATYRSTVVARAGQMVLYNKHDCDANGEYYVMRPGEEINVKALPWADPELRSYCLSASAFDPKNPPV